MRASSTPGHGPRPAQPAEVPVRRTSSRTVYSNAWMRVREDVLVLPDGSDGLYGVVEKPDFALVMPSCDGGFWMVEQFRYPIGRRSWEFPQGSWPEGRTGASSELARAELAQETGLRAARWKHLGRAYAACGFCDQRFDVHLAWELTRGEPDRERTEQDMCQQWFSHTDIDRMIVAGEIFDAHTLAALTLYRLTVPCDTADRCLQ